MYPGFCFYSGVMRPKNQETSLWKVFFTIVNRMEHTTSCRVPWGNIRVSRVVERIRGKSWARAFIMVLWEGMGLPLNSLGFQNLNNFYGLPALEAVPNALVLGPGMIRDFASWSGEDQGAGSEHGLWIEHVLGMLIYKSLTTFRI